MIKNEPCAFCGSIDKDNPRTRGHVLQQSMYPEVGFDRVQRITVPECRRCSANWQHAEEQFRSVMALAADDNEYAETQWNGPIRRAHQREEDGKRRQRDLLKWIISKETPSAAD